MSARDNTLASPTSAILAVKSRASSTLADLRSRWMMGGARVCMYRTPRAMSRATPRPRRHQAY